MILNKLKKLPRLTSEPYAFFGMFVFVSHLMTIPQFVQHKVCHNKYNTTICSHLASVHYKQFQDSVHADAARWMAIIPLSSLIPAIFILVILGPVSNIVGIKVIMVISPLISLLQSITYLILSCVSKPFNPGWIMIGAGLNGFFGEMHGMVLISVVYIASITTVDDRTLRLSLIEAWMFISSCLASLSTGLILDNCGFAGVFIATSIYNTANILYVVLFIPQDVDMSVVTESRHVIVRKEYEAVNTNNSEEQEIKGLVDVTNSLEERLCKNLLEECHPRKSIWRIKTVIFSNDNSKQIPILLAFLACALIANRGEKYIEVLFFEHRPFYLSSSGIGYLVACERFIQALTMVACIYLLQKYLQFTDSMLVIFGFFLQSTFYVLMGVSFSTLMLYLIQPIGTPIHIPVLRSLVSKLVPPCHRGTAFGIFEIVDASCSLVTSLISNVIYAETFTIHSGFAFFILSMVATIGFVFSIVFHLNYKEAEINNLSESDSENGSNVDFPFNSKNDGI